MIAWLLLFRRWHRKAEIDRAREHAWEMCARLDDLIRQQVLQRAKENYEAAQERELQIQAEMRWRD